MALTTHTHLKMSLRRSRAVSLLLLWAFTGGSTVNFIFFSLTLYEQEEICVCVQEQSAVNSLLSNKQVVMCNIHKKCEPEVYSLG